MKEFFLWIGSVAVVVLVLGLLGAVFNIGSLFWYPFKIQMQTEMIRNSNSYYTTELTMLRQFLVDYEEASSPNQRAAILNQMRMAADQLKGNIPPDIAAFLQSH